MCMFDLVEILILEQKNSAFRNRQRPTTKQLLNAPIFCVCVCAEHLTRHLSPNFGQPIRCVISHTRDSHTHTCTRTRTRPQTYSLSHPSTCLLSRRVFSLRECYIRRDLTSDHVLKPTKPNISAFD